MDVHCAFNQWIKRLRTDLDLTQERLAEQVGCSVQTIRAFEGGRRRPSREFAARLATVLQVPPEQRTAFVRLARTRSSPTSRSVTLAQERPAEDGEPEEAASSRRWEQQASRPATSGGQAALEQDPLLATKLYVPAPRGALVSRRHLLARLDAVRARPLTLIAAPAGFGKTTLLAEWLSRQEHDGHKVAWLTLDAGDSDPSLFLRYLIAALQTIAPRVGYTVLSLLQAARAPAIETLLPLLVNDLVHLPDHSILVLDDYHVVEAPAVHRALTFLVEHLPPQLPLVVATRVDPPLPLARWRARGQLSEVRAHDLRFTREEAATFLQEVMDLPLTAQEVAALEARTEGWIAGLQLVALSLRDRADGQQTQFIDAFTGSHRFVVDYLVDEVLARQPAHLQSFLLQTSILERLCGPLCDAILIGNGPPASNGQSVSVGRSAIAPDPLPGAYSQVLLEELERSNLFFVPLDGRRHWYRYHHLFAQVLRERLASGASAEAVATLHRRAAAWFEEQGLIVEAVHHALSAGDWEHTARLIEAHGRLLIVNGHVQTVRGWLNRLPDTVARTHPYLYLIDALGLFFANQLEAAELRLQAAEARLATSIPNERSRSILGYATILHAGIAVARGDLGRCVRLAREGIELLPATDVARRTAARIHLAQVHLLSGDVSPANERLVAAHAAAARASGEMTNLFYAIVTLAGLQRRQGRLRQAAATYREAAGTIPDPSGIPALPDGANYYFGLGDVLREWNDLDEAAVLLEEGRAMICGMRLAQAEVVVAGFLALARVQQARGDALGALATLVELGEVAHQRSFVPHLRARAAAARAHLLLVQGDLDTAVQWAGTSGLNPDDALSYPRELEYLTLARVCIAQGRRDPAGPVLRDARHLLDRLFADAEAGARMDSVIEILLLRALALQAQGDGLAARVDLERALTLAEPENYVRLFVDEGAPAAVLLRDIGLGAPQSVAQYARRLLDAFPANSVAGVTPAAGQGRADTPSSTMSMPAESLTEREMEVLRLLAAGRSNQMIADELIVAVGTVKRHVNSILGKLQAQSRLEAVARAREIGLV